MDGTLQEKQRQEKNKSFQILTGIAILFVVCGHLDLQTFTLFDLFPYYSFHVMIFVFVSGYFYKEENENSVGRYISKKAKHLLLPYFIWNMFYGVIVTILHRFGFGFGEDLSLKTLFIQPFVDGHQYMLNFASWFVPSLFLLHLCNLFGRKILKYMVSFVKVEERTGAILCDVLILVGTLILGMATAYLSIKGHVWGYWKMPGRILFMIPVYEMGFFYKKYLEEYANEISDLLVIAATVVIQVILRLTCKSLVYSVVWCTNFHNGPVVPYITTITGIVFWYRIAKLISKIPDHHRLSILSRTLKSFGDMSFSVMMHHVFAFFLIKCVSYYMYLHHVGNGFELFDLHMFRYSVDYVYWIYDWPATKWLYLAAGLGLAALFYQIEVQVKQSIGRRKML